VASGGMRWKRARVGMPSESFIYDASLPAHGSACLVVLGEESAARQWQILIALFTSRVRTRVQQYANKAE